MKILIVGKQGEGKSLLARGIVFALTAVLKPKAVWVTEDGTTEMYGPKNKPPDVQVYIHNDLDIVVDHTRRKLPKVVKRA
jgi:hypothetical protein